MTIAEKIRTGRIALEKVHNPSLETELIISHVLEKDKLYLMMNPEKELTAGESKQIDQLIDRRSQGYPLQYILGSWEFMGLNFLVKEGVLIPRPDTETLVELVLKKLKLEGNRPWKGLEIGCGTGIISISLLKNCDNLQMEAVDINDIAIELAIENGENLAVSERLKVSFSDLFSSVKPDQQYDFIVSNPPYIRSSVIPTLQPEIRDYEPHNALDGLTDGLYFYRQILSQGKKHLKANGFVALEIGHDQAKDLEQILGNEGYHNIFVEKDLSGWDRVVYAESGMSSCKEREHLIK